MLLFIVISMQSKNGGRNVQSPDSNYNRMMYDGNISPSSVKTAQKSFQFQVMIHI